MNISIRELSIPKTLLFNLIYFGWGSVFKPQILLSKNVNLVHMGGNVKIDSFKCKRVYLGFKVSGIVDAKNERFCWDNRGTVCFEEGVFLGSGVRISNSGNLFFGSGCFVSANTSIVCTKEISIGRGCKVSWSCLIMDSDFHKIVDVETNKTLNAPRSIILSENVWVGCNSIILKGSFVPTKSIIAAGSVTGKELSESNCIYRDNNVIRRGVNWED